MTGHVGGIPIPSRRALWSIRLYYFARFGGIAFLMPFLSLFFRRWGLTGTEIGLLASLGAVLTLLVAPMWGRWSDRASEPRRVLQVALVATALCGLCLSQQRVLLGIAVVRSIQALVGAGIEPLSDALVLSIIHRSSRDGFGSVRLWGSLGWAIIVLLSGWVVERTGLFAAFLGYAVSLVVSALILNLMDVAAPSEKVPPIESRPGVWSTVQDLLRNRGMVVLAIALVFLWLASGGLYQFEPIFLDELGASESLIGFSSMLRALAELPGMVWADRLVRRYGPYRILCAAVLLSAILRTPVLMSPTAAIVVGVRTLAGVSFGFFSVALVVFVIEQSSAQQGTTIWALFSVTLRSLIRIVGAPLGGLIFDAFGAYWLYAIALAGGILSWLTLRFAIPRQIRKVLL